MSAAAAAPLVDWSVATAVAAKVVSGGPDIGRDRARAVVTELAVTGAEAAEHVAAFTGLHPQHVASPVRVVDRPAWVRSNLDGIRAVIEPALEVMVRERPGRLVTAVGSRVTGAQVGAIFGYLSARVLGQYEVFSGEPGQLLLVAPNVVQVERLLGVDTHDFRLWVCLHEVAHRTQFTAVGWLREHFLAEIDRLVRATDPDTVRERLGRALGEMVRAARGGSGSSLLTLVQTTEQREVMDRLTALMTLLEGHAEYVMNGVGPQVVPTVETIRERFGQRRHGVNAIDRVFRRLLGVEAKMRQYAEGSRFVGEVVDSVGMAGFNQVWTSPNTLPTRSEIADPQRWIRRVHPHAGGEVHGSDVEGSDVDTPGDGADPDAR